MNSTFKKLLKNSGWRESKVEQKRGQANNSPKMDIKFKLVAFRPDQ
jgi:hypothetical protein